MNKRYDNYLCRSSSKQQQHIIRTDQYGRMYTWIGTDKYFLSTPYPAGDIEICDLTPAEQSEQGQLDCIKLGFKFYGWLFSSVFVLAAITVIWFN